MQLSMACGRLGKFLVRKLIAVRGYNRVGDSAVRPLASLSLSLLMLGAFIVLSVGFSVDPVGSFVEWSLLVVNLILGTAMLGFSLIYRPFSVFSVFAYFVTIFYCVVPLIWLLSDSWPFASGFAEYADGVFATGQFYVCLWILMFLVGYFAIGAGRRDTSKSQADSARVGGDRIGQEQLFVWRLRKFWATRAFALVCLLLLGYFALGGTFSDALFRSESLEGAGVGEMDATRQRIAGDVLSAARRASLFAVLIAGALISVSGVKSGRMRLWALSGLTLLLNLPFSVSRAYLFAVALAIMAFLFGATRYRTLSAILLYFGGLYASAIIDIFKRTVIFGTGSLQVSFDYLQSGHFQSFETFMSQIVVAGDQGLKWGANLLGMMLMHVPRAIWADKPSPPSLELAAAYYFPKYGWYHNVGASTVGSFYQDFHIIGIALFGLAIGFLGKWSDTTLGGGLSAPRSHLAVGLRSPASISAYPFVLGCLLVFFRGSSWTGFNLIVSSIFVYYIVRFVMLKKVRGVPSDCANGR